MPTPARTWNYHEPRPRQILRRLPGGVDSRSLNRASYPLPTLVARTGAGTLRSHERFCKGGLFGGSEVYWELWKVLVLRGSPGNQRQAQIGELPELEDLDEKTWREYEENWREYLRCLSEKEGHEVLAIYGPGPEYRMLPPC